MSLPPGQRQLAFSPTVRDTPRRNRTIINYRNIERIDEPITNPPSTPTVARRVIQTPDNEEDKPEPKDKLGLEDKDGNPTEII